MKTLKLSKRNAYEEIVSLTGRHKLQNVIGEATLIYVPLQLLLRACTDGSLKLYANNRGRGKSASATVKKILTEGFDKTKCLELKLADLGDSFVLADGHSRWEAIQKLCRKGDLYPETVELKIMVYPADDFLKVYEASNSGRPHTPKNKSDNPDMPAGQILVNLAKKANHYLLPSQKQSAWMILQAAIEAERTNAGSPSLVDALRLGWRSKVTPLLGHTSLDDRYYPSENISRKFVDAIRWYSEYQRAIYEAPLTGRIKKRSRGDALSAKAEKDIRSGLADGYRILSYFLIDAFNETPALMKLSPTAVANAFLNNQQEIYKLACGHSTGSVHLVSLDHTIKATLADFI